VTGKEGENTEKSRGRKKKRRQENLRETGKVKGDKTWKKEGRQGI
jgi:hypothetical protein